MHVLLKYILALVAVVLATAPLAHSNQPGQGGSTTGTTSGEITSVTYNGQTGYATSFTINSEPGTVITCPNPNQSLTDTIRDAATNDRDVTASWEQVGSGPKNLKNLTVNY